MVGDPVELRVAWLRDQAQWHGEKWSLCRFLNTKRAEWHWSQLNYYQTLYKTLLAEERISRPLRRLSRGDHCVGIRE